MRGESPAEITPSQRRLQRPPDFTGGRLTTFSAVFLRHGLPGFCLALLCLLHPELTRRLPALLQGFTAAPLAYVAAGLGIGAGLMLYVALLDRRLDARQAGWIGYLLLVSVWEEWVFRVALPAWGIDLGLSQRTAVIASSVLFGLAHYFTLRWKWPWCLAAALGGMALSRNLGHHQDLALIIALHWIATFLNTPRPPGRRRAVRST